MIKNCEKFYGFEKENPQFVGLSSHLVGIRRGKSQMTLLSTKPKKVKAVSMTTPIRKKQWLSVSQVKLSCKGSQVILLS